MDKEEFLKEYGEDYGYPSGPKSIDEIRATEFKRLQNGTVYLDHAGATLYSELQMEAILKDLTSSVYGNPHSQNDSSSATCDIVKEARQQVLDYFKASPKDYKCIFTSGATAALKLVGETFPWDHQSCFMYTMENHNSVLGIREYALSQGASTCAVDIEEELHHSGICDVQSIKIAQHPVQRREEPRSLERGPTGTSYNLFAFPSECNFSGLRFKPDLVKIIKEDSEKLFESSAFSRGCWKILIDGAKGCATQMLDLSKFPADFVVISFYKLFGYPTGLGALIVRTDVSKLLKKKYFGGGTVAAAFADVDYVKTRKDVEERFEDGTVSFLSIASIQYGFKILNSLTISAIARHTASLASYVKNTLLALKHENGAGVFTLYGSHSLKVFHAESGPVVSFNLKRPDGSWVGYREVEKLASLSGIQLRTGCFCNPGACAKYIGLSHSELLTNIEAGHVCWDDNDIIHGKPTGAARISFGYMSTYEDAKKFIDFISSSFVTLWITSGSGNIWNAGSLHLSSKGCGPELSTTYYHLKSITVYPIKSCAGFSVGRWPLCTTGLLHDREWLLKSLTGEVLTQKKVPEMCLVSTFIDLEKEILFVESPRCPLRLEINLKANSYVTAVEEINMHAQRYEVQCYENEVNRWFTNAIARPCTLLRSSTLKQSKNRRVAFCRDVESKLNFPNEAQLLLISEESISELNDRLSLNAQKGMPKKQVQVDSLRFRPNLVISGGEPYAEDKWRNLEIGNNYFTTLGGCNRCQMINFNNQAGQVQKSNEPLATLASYRRVKGKILFGILLKYEDGDELGKDKRRWLQVGQEVRPNLE